jgi:two-component system, cell cycle sensor histidine kinase and response regulator CckA
VAPGETVILLAEDEALVRNLVQLMLTREGYAVLSANDGQEALELSEAFKDPIHLLLTDVRMPRMDGITLKELVRTQRPEIKVIVMSGETANIIAIENTPDAFLRKPFIPPTLLKCVQRVLAEAYSGVCEAVET